MSFCSQGGGGVCPTPLDAALPGLGQTPPDANPPEAGQAPPGWADPPKVGQTPPDADPLGLGRYPPRMQTLRVGQTPPGCRPPGVGQIPRYGQQAGGTHPTGMYTCKFYSFTLREIGFKSCTLSKSDNLRFICYSYLLSLVIPEIVALLIESQLNVHFFRPFCSVHNFLPSATTVAEKLCFYRCLPVHRGGKVYTLLPGKHPPGQTPPTWAESSLP